MEGKLRFASCMAPNAEPFFIDTAHYLSRKLGVEAIVSHDIDWESRERDLDSGEIDVGWICGLPYVWKADLPSPIVSLLAAPVMRGARYQDQPIYFSDVMVRSDSHVETFAELRGARWAYNEPRSHSGYSVVKSHLYDLGETDGFFGSAHMAGSHQRALEMILEGAVDAAAIDTTVFEIAAREDPSLERKFRSVETLGPSPMPPWVVSTQVDPFLRERIQFELTHMHDYRAGRQLLRRYAVARYQAVEDAFYDPIRSMDRKASQVHLSKNS
jgi:phosphonate transport system substrate-binding protein